MESAESMPDDGPGAIEFGDVRFTAATLDQLDGGRTQMFLRREAIRSISLKYGVQAERPTAQAAFSVVIFLGGFWPILRVLSGRIHHYEACMLGLFPFGAWGFFTAFRKGYYLQVDLENDRRRVAFVRSATREEIESFLFLARSLMGYEIEAMPEED